MTRMTMYQLLGSLCRDRRWNYAVLWKRKNNKLLWGEAYCDFPKSGCVVKNVAATPFANKGVVYNAFGSVMVGSSPLDVGHPHPLELIVANMAGLEYSLGEGVVGQIVTNKKHRWVSAEGDGVVGESSILISDLPDEWKTQFAAGIKTIALVPAFPSGVMQLGSLASLREDVNLVDHISSLFISLNMPSGADFSHASVGGSSERSCFLNSCMSANSLAFSSASHNIWQASQAPGVGKDHGLAVVDVQPEKNKLLDIKPQVSSLSSFLDDRKNDLESLDDHKFGHTGTCLNGKVGEPMSSVLPTTSLEPSGVPNDRLDGHCLDESCMERIGYDSNMRNKGFLDAACFSYEENTSGQLFEGGISWCPSQTAGDDTFRFPANSELHKALGQAFHNQGGENFCQSNVVNNADLNSASPIINQFDLEGRVETLLYDFQDWFVDRKNSEYLLDAIVSDACFSPQSITSPQVALANASGNSFGSFDLKPEARDDFLDPTLDYMCEEAGIENLPSRSDNMRSSSCKMEDFSTRSNKQDTDSLGGAFFSWSEQSITAASDSTPMKLSTLIDEAKRTNPASHLSKNEFKVPQMNKKRAKPGEICRPRQRDRQQIQDRIKELREIVPNAAKCSIDSLFERTIKHMLFLRSITNHVDKLRSCTRSKVVKEGSDVRYQNGASWAVELGSEAGSCPLVVENLSQPGHMLVEMLCEEHGVFLEMAQVIRSLGLTILKGVMETRADKIWAHFVIEVTRGFQRMDILWPLMQLLQPRNNSAAVGNNF